MDLAAFETLLTPAGRDALHLADELEPREEDFLPNIAALRRKGVADALARAALETAGLRRKARSKFSRAAAMYFTREALEQASAEELSRHRAARFAGTGRIADLGCGIGGDALALAQAAPLLAVDRDELRLRMARENVAAYQPPFRARYAIADLAAPGLPRALGLNGAALYADPGRRTDEGRVFSVRQYSPPLDVITAWRGAAAEERLCVKISPGVQWEEIEREDCEVEFVSWRTELREAVLWYGAFRTSRRRATLLPQNVTLTEADPAVTALSQPLSVLYEPDPAILRAGLVRQVAAILGAAQIDPQIAYLTADEYRLTPWARAFRVEDVLPFGLKRLREYLRQRGVGRVVIKKRGSPVDVADLEHQLRLKGEENRTLFLTQAGGRPIVIVANGQGVIPNP